MNDEQQVKIAFEYERKLADERHDHKHEIAQLRIEMAKERADYEEQIRELIRERDDARAEAKIYKIVAEDYKYHVQVLEAAKIYPHDLSRLMTFRLEQLKHEARSADSAGAETEAT